MKTALILLASLFVLFTESYSQWTQTNLHGTRINRFASNDSFLFACTSDGLFRSSDNGNHWQELTSTLKYKSFIPMALIGNSIITPLYSSSNNGTDWEEHDLKYPSYNAIVVVDDTVLFCGNGTGVRYSTDKGFSWQKAGSGIPEGTQIFSLAKSGSTLYAGGEGEVYISTNKGKTWGNLGNTQSWNEDLVYHLYTKDSIVFANVANQPLLYKTPSDPLWKSTNLEVGYMAGLIQKDSVLFAGSEGNGILHRSTNNGKEWYPLSLYIEPSIKELNGILSMIMKGNTLFVATAYGRVYYSSDEGNTWQESKNIGLHGELQVVHLASCGGILFAAISYMGISTSSDNGLSWTLTDITQTPIALFSNGTSVFALLRSSDPFPGFGPYDSLIRSTDCGATWSRLHYGFNDSLRYQFAQCNSVLYAYADTEVYKSTDNGDSWEKINVDFNKIIQVTTEGSAIYFLTDKYIIFSEDQGQTWVSINHRQKQYTFIPISIAVKDKKIFLGTNNQGLQFIESPLDINNQKIVKIHNGIPSRLFYKFIVNGSSIFAQTYNQIYKSTDDGKSWFVVDSLIPGYLIYRFIAHGSALYITRGTTGVWKYENILDVNSDENPESIQDSHILCYPNPTGNSLTINRTDLVFNNSLSVHYILSNSIGEKVMEFEQSGQVFTVQLDELPGGVYSLSATQGAQRATVMVSVLK